MIRKIVSILTWQIDKLQTLLKERVIESDGDAIDNRPKTNLALDIGKKRLDDVQEFLRGVLAEDRNSFGIHILIQHSLFAFQLAQTLEFRSVDGT